MLNPAQFTLITQHSDGKTRRKRFDDYDSAVAHAQSINPDSDPSMMPNVDQRHADHPGYEKGFFWHGNRYAVLINKRPSP